MPKTSLITLFTKEQHTRILTENKGNAEAAKAYDNSLGWNQPVVSRQLVAYWRKIFVDNSGNKRAVVQAEKEAVKLIQPSPTDDIGDTDVPEVCRRILVIGDLHAPYTHKDAMEFLRHMRDTYKPDMVIQVGDECFPPEAEVLTPAGWTRFDELPKGVPVAQVHADLSLSFSVPLRYVEKQATEGLLEYKHRTMVSRTTPRHNLVKMNPSTGTLHRREAWDTAGTESWYIPRTATYVGGNGVALSDEDLQLLVAFQADGTFTRGAARFEFQKEAKATRLVSILNDLNIPYTSHNTSRDTFQYYIKVADTPEYLTKEFDFDYSQFSQKQLQVLVEEFQYWDSTVVGNGYRYTCTRRSNVEAVQIIAQLAGYATSVISMSGSAYYVTINSNRESCSLKSATVSQIEYTGMVYCVTVDTGMILVRQDGHVSVSGNCDGHAISFHDSDVNLDSAGVELEKAKIVMEELYDLFPNLLICDSNHGSLIYRRAKAHGIPVQFIKKYRDILFPEHGAQKWSWADAWVLNTPLGPVRFQHQVSGDLMLNASHERMSMVIGHHHGKYDITYAASSSALYFGAHAGCLIDNKSLAFAYGKLSKGKPIMGVMTITDGCPSLIPMLMNASGRWSMSA